MRLYKDGWFQEQAEPSGVATLRDPRVRHHDQTLPYEGHPLSHTQRLLYDIKAYTVVQEPNKKDPVIVAGKDVGEVDMDYFLIPVNIRDHEGPLDCSFPVENRLLPQGAQAVTAIMCRRHLKEHSKSPKPIMQ